jgi:ubiquinone/menaquinone biosynthesis C-methylase UbiE
MLTALSLRFRRRRMQRFLSTFSITSETRILDVGGTPDVWRLVSAHPKVTLLNTPRTREDQAATDWVAGDGCCLPFRDQAFDIVFSNSVIEHVGDAAHQARFAKEIRRVGRSYWVQTPNRWFPVEQHLLTPFVHWLPKSWQVAVVPRFTVWSLITPTTPDRKRFYLDHFLTDIRLLSAGEVSRLFPDARIVRERFAGWTKSLIAYNRHRDA